MIHFGTSSFSEPDWVGVFYPTGTKSTDFIKFYSSKYDTVEIDSTYYAIPSQASINNWISKTEQNFTISAKFPKSITHCGEKAVPNQELIMDIKKTSDDTERFLQQMHQLGSRLGPMILQFPYFSKKIFPDKNIFYERLNNYVARLPKEFKFGVEIRNKYWLSKEYASILKQYNIALVLQDHPWMPMGDEIEKFCDPHTSDFMYIRLLGDRKEIEAITSHWDKEVINKSEILDRWATFLAENTKEKMPTYTYINNHYEGHSPSTLEKLKSKYLQLL